MCSSRGDQIWQSACAFVPCSLTPSVLQLLTTADAAASYSSGLFMHIVISRPTDSCSGSSAIASFAPSSSSPFPPVVASPPCFSVASAAVWSIAPPESPAGPLEKAARAVDSASAAASSAAAGAAATPLVPPSASGAPADEAGPAASACALAATAASPAPSLPGAWSSPPPAAAPVCAPFSASADVPCPSGHEGGQSRVSCEPIVVPSQT